MKSSRGYAVIGLHNTKYAVNVGGVLRAVGNFDASMVAVTGKRYKHSATDIMKSYRHIPVLQVEDLHSVIPFDCVPVAVDLIKGAQSLTNYVHPERAFYIFGAEDATLGHVITDWCRDIIYIPTRRCMNLATTVAVVLYDRMLKKCKS